MKELIGILFSELVVKWFIIWELFRVLTIDECVIIHGLFPLILGWELLESWELPSFEGVVLGHILITSHVHLEVELRLIWLTLITSHFYQMLIVCSISSVVEVNAYWSQVALSRLSSLENSSELVVKVRLVRLTRVEAGLSRCLLHSSVESTIFSSFEICVSSKTHWKFLGPTEMSLELVPLLVVLGELSLPS